MYNILFSKICVFLHIKSIFFQHQDECHWGTLSLDCAHCQLCFYFVCAANCSFFNFVAVPLVLVKVYEYIMAEDEPDFRQMVQAEEPIKGVLFKVRQLYA